MIIAIFAVVSIGLNTVLAVLVSAILAAGATFGAVGKRARDLADLYQGLYQGKAVQVAELEMRLTQLESRVQLYESDFTKKIAEGVTEAILRTVTDALPHLLDEAHTRDHLGDRGRERDRNA
jgi:hypothetical protein